MSYLIIQPVSLYRNLDQQRTETGEIPEEGAVFPIPDGFFLHSVVSAEPSLGGLQGERGTVKNIEWFVFAPNRTTSPLVTEEMQEQALHSSSKGKSKTTLMGEFMMLWERQNPRSDKDSGKQLELSKSRMKRMLMEAYGLKFPSALTKEQLIPCVEKLQENIKENRIDPIK